jgi:endonuclease/exonuclease/phosphatase family metal-dependent hydrolase
MNRFEALDFGTIWLSETPLDTGSIGWDAALPRIMTWVKFRDMHLQRQGNFYEFYFLNTHFDHLGDTAREESALLILDFIKENTEGRNVVLTGDFNFSPGEVPYLLLSSVDTNDYGMTDAISMDSEEKIMKGDPTFNGFGNEQGKNRIDFIFISPGWNVLSWETLAIIENGIYISDHYPVISRIKTNHY